MYTDRELEEYGEYMDWVRERIAGEDGSGDPRFKSKLIDIDEISMEKGPDGILWRHHWSGTYSDGNIAVGEIRTLSFPDWIAEKKKEARNSRIDELLR